jgi:hypothetical protein
MTLLDQDHTVTAFGKAWFRKKSNESMCGLTSLTNGAWISSGTLSLVRVWNFMTPGILA